PKEEGGGDNREPPDGCLISNVVRTLRIMPNHEPGDKKFLAVHHFFINTLIDNLNDQQVVVYMFIFIH
ncbi:MAG: hypothetical protein ACM35F_06930, partial [Betaproteobacteria bacterium]